MYESFGEDVMFNYYDDIYLRRLNRYGTSRAERVQNMRVENFLKYMDESIYRVTFEDSYKGEEIVGVLTPYKKDETETLNVLKVPLNYDYPAGTLFHIRNNLWMVLYKHDLVGTGYNEFTMMKMTHVVSWKDRNGDEHQSPAYFYGPMTEKIYDMLRTYLKGVVYKEGNKYTHLIMPRNQFILRQDYMVIDNEGYEVTGFDKVSTPGVMYITLNETHVRDESEPPKKLFEKEKGEDFFWFTGEDN